MLRCLKRWHCSKAVVAACMYGMRPKRASAPDELMSKTWRVSSSCAEFTAFLDRRCDRSHRHVAAAGGETAATAYYPPQLAKAIHMGLHNWAGTSPKEILGRVPSPGRSAVLP